MDVTFQLDTADLALRYRNMSQTQYNAGVFLLTLLAIQKGANVLDVGAGTGEHVAKIAELVGDAGFVTGVEPLAARVKLAQEAYTALGNTKFTVGSAENLSLFDSFSMNAIFCNASYHWFSQPESALAEFYRVLKTGGSVGISTGSGDHPYIQDVIKDEVLAQERFRNYPQLKKGVARYPTREELVRSLKGAGFAIKVVAEHHDTRPFNTATDALSFVQASSFGNFLGHIPEELHEAARQELIKEFEKYRRGDIIEFEIVRLVVVAIKK